MPAQKKGVRGSAAKRSGVAAKKQPPVKKTPAKSAAKKIAKKAAKKVAKKTAPPPAVPLVVVEAAPAVNMREAMAAAPRPINISEIFVSIQGEGRHAGMPSVFVRLNGCNLRCDWCDTPYTSWKPEGSEWMFGQLLAHIRRQGLQHVVITGGEPMLQQGLVLLTQRLKEMDFIVTIETAGTVSLPVTCDLMSISPKLANSTPRRREGGRFAVRHDSLRYNPEVLKQLITDHDYQLKFVVQTADDMTEVNQIVKDLEADKSRVVLMGEGTDPGTLYERAQWITEACKYWGYRYSPRLHIDIWGNERGK